MNSSGFTG